MREADQPAVLAQIRQLAGDGGDDFARLALATAETRIGESERARSLLTPHLEARPDDADALYVFGSAYLRDSEAVEGEAMRTLQAQARRYFSRAYRADPNHVPSLYGYAASYFGVMMDEETSQNYLNVLLLSHQLAPQIDQISLNAASALMMHGRHAEAVPMLRAVAYDPHGGGNTRTALEMLQQAEAALAEAR